MNNKRISDINYFENYFRRYIQIWQASSKDIRDFIEIDINREQDIKSFINSNKNISGPSGLSKNASFLSIIIENIPDNDDEKGGLLLKLIKYSDTFYENEEEMLYGKGFRVFLPIKKLIESFANHKKLKEILSICYNEFNSFHILFKITSHYRSNDLKIIDKETILHFQEILLKRLESLDASSFSKINCVSDVLFTWKEWLGTNNFDEQKKYLNRINLVNEDKCFANFLIKMRSINYSSTSGKSYYIPYIQLMNFFGMKKETINNRISELKSSQNIDEILKNQLDDISFIENDFPK